MLINAGNILAVTCYNYAILAPKITYSHNHKSVMDVVLYVICTLFAYNIIHICVLVESRRNNIIYNIMYINYIYYLIHIIQLQ